MSCLWSGLQPVLVEPRGRGSYQSFCEYIYIYSFIAFGAFTYSGLSICEATTVIFNSGLGATIAAVPYFANLSGYLGFVFVTVAMAVTGVLEQQTLLRASADRNAKTFDELCQPIPAWARQMTVWCGLVYLWACAGWYFHFVLSFVEAQLCPVLCRSSGDNFLCQSRWHFGFPIGIMLFAVSFPAELSGSMSRAINCTSMIAKTTAILIALVKGALVWHQKTEASELIAWKPTAFAAVASNMIGTFANTGIMPQVAADLKPSLLHRAVRICPCSAVSNICGIYCLKLTLCISLLATISTVRKNL